MPEILSFKVAAIKASQHMLFECCLLFAQRECVLLDKHVYTHTCIMQLELTVYGASSYNP